MTTLDLNFPGLGRGTFRLEAAFLYCLFDGGRGNPGTADKVNKLLERVRLHEGPEADPFVALHDWWDRDVLGIVLKECGLGKINRFETLVEKLLLMNLDEATEEELLAIPGFGPKTVEFFIQNARNARMSIPRA